VWVNHSAVFAGPHNEAILLRGALAERRWETLAVVPDEPGTAAERLRAGGVETVEVPLHRARASLDPRINLSTLRALRGEVRRLRELIERRSIDVVIVQGVTNPHGAMAARRAGAATVWRVIDSHTPPFARRPAMGMVRHYADSVMFNGIALRSLYAGSRPLKVPSISYTPVVDLGLYSADPAHRAEARERMGVPQDVLFVGTVANLNPTKGIEYFVRAAPRIFRSRPDAHFLISGGVHENHRSYVARIDAEIAASGVPAERWHRRQGPAQGCFPALDVHLVTSVPDSEGTTTTALEAAASGTPVVATNVGAVPEVVEDGVTGLVVPPLDPDALAGATLRLAEEPELWKRISAAARRRAEERFGVEVGADKHAWAFDAAHERHPRSPSPPSNRH
jgi:glycosyltransferase involved in cell wall biosynthesis